MVIFRMGVAWVMGVTSEGWLVLSTTFTTLALHDTLILTYLHLQCSHYSLTSV